MSRPSGGGCFAPGLPLSLATRRHVLRRTRNVVLGYTAYWTPVILLKAVSFAQSWLKGWLDAGDDDDDAAAARELWHDWEVGMCSGFLVPVSCPGPAGWRCRAVRQCRVRGPTGRPMTDAARGGDVDIRRGDAHRRTPPTDRVAQFYRAAGVNVGVCVCVCVWFAAGELHALCDRGREPRTLLARARAHRQLARPAPHARNYDIVARRRRADDAGASDALCFSVRVLRVVCGFPAPAQRV